MNLFYIQVSFKSFENILFLKTGHDTLLENSYWSKFHNWLYFDYGPITPNIET